MDEDLHGYLRGKGLEVFQAAGREVTLHCVFCPDGDAKGKGKLYVNAETWLYDCKRCMERGNRRSLLAHFGDVDDATYLPGANPASRMMVLGQYATAAADLLTGNETMIGYLLGRGLSVETILDSRFGYVPKGYGICATLPGPPEREHFTSEDLKASGMLTERGTEFHQGKITIPYLSRDHVLQVRGKDPAGKYFTPAGDNVRLYNADALRGAEYVLVVEGEFDTKITEQHLQGSSRPQVRALQVVGVPGAGAWPGGAEGFGDYFRDCKRVYIGFDPDETGRRDGLKLKDALGSKARIVNLPMDVRTDTKGQPVKADWTEYLRRPGPDHPFGGHNAVDVWDLVQTAEMEGKRIFTVGETRVSWEKSRRESPGLKLGWPSLDSLLDPGIRPGNVVVPLSKTGTGKTVLLGNLDYTLRDRRVLHVTLENTAVELFEIQQRVFRFWNPALEAVNIDEALPNLRIVDENRLGFEDLRMIVSEYREDVGEAPQVLLVDYLGYLAQGQRGSSDYERTSAAIFLLKEMSKEFNLTTVAPHQVSRRADEGESFESSDARDSGKVEETADYVLGLYRPHRAKELVRSNGGSVDEDLMVDVQKSRSGGAGRKVRLAMSAASLVIVDRRDTAALARVQQENEAVNRGMKYRDIVAAARQVALGRQQLTLVDIA